MTRATYQDLIWVIMQIALYNNVLEVPELLENENKWYLIFSSALTVSSLVGKLVQINLMADGLKED